MNKEKLAYEFGISEEEACAAGKLLFIFGHETIRREPVTSNQLSTIYVESNFNRKAFGNNKYNDSNSTIRRLLSTWAKVAREDPDLARDVHCESTGCIVEEPHRLCSRRDNTWVVYYMRLDLWDALYGDPETFQPETLAWLQKVIVSDANLIFHDAENEMIQPVDTVEQDIETQVAKNQEQDIEKRCEKEFLMYSTAIKNNEKRVHVEMDMEMQVDALFEELFPFQFVKA